MKVSIIVPVYNTEQYLRQCLDSLVNQTLQDVEIICVDNGSTDRSFEVLSEYESKHNNIKVLKHFEGRQGAARNAGVKVAQGEYIGFVDSDDFADVDMFEKMYNEACLHQADIAICNINLYFQDNNLIRLHLPEKWFNKNPFEILQSIFFFRNLTICNKIFKRTFLENYNIVFPENYYYEDQVYVVKAYAHAAMIVALRQPFYFYRKQREGSVSLHYGERVFDIFPIMKMLENYFTEKKINENIYDILSEIKISRYIQIFHALKHKYKNKYFAIVKKELLKIHSPFSPIILSQSEYNDFILINKHSFCVCTFIFFFQKDLKRIISASLLGTVYRSMKSIF